MLDTAAGGWYHIGGAGIRQAEKTERRGQTMAYKNSRQNAAETKTSSEKNEKKLKKLVYGLRIGAAAYLLLALFSAAAVKASGAAASADWNTVSRLSEIIAAVFFLIFGGSILANAFRRRNYISPDLKKLFEQGKVTEKYVRTTPKTNFVCRCVFSGIVIAAASVLLITAIVRLF